MMMKPSLKEISKLAKLSSNGQMRETMYFPVSISPNPSCLLLPSTCRLLCCHRSPLPPTALNRRNLFTSLFSISSFWRENSQSIRIPTKEISVLGHCKAGLDLYNFLIIFLCNHQTKGNQRVKNGSKFHHQNTCRKA
ncbi:unnamed protein product [Lactuca saligna]|uniref:Uncharacterized protein n=1 Tax=Lactuca saligna TaxID=75948 RepID=A0AA35YDQ7_LACSI|nr:unnamed protein product [Lactuca saligna]